MNLPGWLADRAACLGTIEARCDLPVLTEADIDAALRAPIGDGPAAAPIFDLVKPGESLCFVVSDHTRKTATDAVLPVIIAGLRERGCRTRDMHVLFASGIHRPPTDAEIEHILGAPSCAAFAGRIHRHDPDDSRALVTVGRTSRGHGVRVNRLAVSADRLVPIGAATYHYHAGYGGGRKSLVPGIAARETIAHNHSLTLDPDHDRIRPGVDVGRLDGNAVAQEMLESGAMCKPTTIVNTVLDPGGRLVGVFAGDLDAAHRAACRLVDKTCRFDLPAPADFVIASAGEATDWIQSHKALFNASRAVKPEGHIVLVAPCPEGIGNDRFRYWVSRDSVETIYRELRRSPEVLGQTALSTRLRGARAILVTQMPEQEAVTLGIETRANLDAAIETVLRHGGRTYYAMPQARYTVPFISR